MFKSFVTRTFNLSQMILPIIPNYSKETVTYNEKEETCTREYRHYHNNENTTILVTTGPFDESILYKKGDFTIEIHDGYFVESRLKKFVKAVKEVGE